jgi:hypothetical protein
MSGKYSRTARKAAFAARVKKVIMKTAETKYVMGTAENVSLYHDRGTVGPSVLSTHQGAIIFNPWFAITRGDTVSNRDGDEIYPRGMAVRMCYWCAADRQAQYVRIIVAVIPKIVSGYITDGTNFDLLDAAGSNDTVTGFVKREGVKVLYDKVWTGTAKGKTEDADELGDNRLYKQFYIKSKKGSKVSWQQDGTLSNKPVGIWVIPYDDYNTLRTDILGRCTYTYKLYFKDV